MMLRPSSDILLIISYSIAALFGLAVLFSCIVFYLHARNERAQTHNAELERLWEPALLEALAAGPAAFGAERLVATRERLRFVKFLVRYARRLRGTERAVLETLAAPYLPEISRRVGSGPPERRAYAVQTLTTLGMPAYADVVIRALDDPSPLVGMTAARGLAREEHAGHAAEVLARIDRFAQWNPRFLAAMLSSMGAAATPALRTMLADASASRAGRALVADALTQLRDLESADAAARILIEESDRELLAAALGLLAVVGHAGHLPAVLRLLDSAESWVRAQALETLARLGAAEHAPLLRHALADTSPWVALRAAYGLQEIGATDELERLALQTGSMGELAREVLSRAGP